MMDDMKSRASRKVAVLGPIPRDQVIVPISHVRQRDEGPVRQILGSFPDIDYVVACQYGNAMGAQRCTGTDLNVYLSREDTERQILAAYGPRSHEEVP
jgi:adenosine kinase